MTSSVPDAAACVEASAQLRAVLGEVERGELAAEPDRVAYLRGAADALALLGEGVSKSTQ